MNLNSMNSIGAFTKLYVLVEMNMVAETRRCEEKRVENTTRTQQEERPF